MSMDQIYRDLEVYDQKSGEGDKEAKYWVGYCYMYAHDTSKWPKGMDSWRQAAAHGSGKARAQLGFCYKHGEGCDVDLFQSEIMYQQAVEPLKIEAAQGDSESQGLLGYLYQNGLGGLETNYERMIELYMSAVSQNNTIAQNLLAGCYRNGVGVPKDPAKAAELYEKSATQGESVSQNCLGNLYEEGSGVERNREKAAYWYGKSAAQNNPEGQCLLARCYREGWIVVDDGIDKKAASEAKAFALYQVAANRGHACGQGNLGYCYQMGIGVEKDDMLAVVWYHKSAQQGEPVAKGNLESLVSEVKSYNIPTLDPKAMRTLAYCYEHGAGITQDLDISQAWQNEAIYQENRLLEQHVDSYQVPKTISTRQLSSEEPKCVCCEERITNVTIIHGETGHSSCCFLCAQLCQFRKPHCPICRLSIDQVALNLPLLVPNEQHTNKCQSCGTAEIISMAATWIVHGSTCHPANHLCLDCARSQKGLECLECGKTIDGAIQQFQS